MIDNLLTTIAAAKILGVSDARVRQLAIKGHLIGKKFGHMWLFTNEAVEQAKTIKRVAGRKPGIKETKPRKRKQSK